MRTVAGRVRIGSDGADAGPADVDEGERGYFPSLEAFLAALEAVAADHDVTIQAFDARYVAGEEHLRAAVEHAERAMDRGTNVADDLAVEILCYAAGRRQIDRAMEMGLAEGDNDVIVVLSGPDAETVAPAVQERVGPADTTPDEAVIQAFFEITDRERAASAADLETLVLERVALLDVEK